MLRNTWICNCSVAETPGMSSLRRDDAFLILNF